MLLDLNIHGEEIAKCDWLHRIQYPSQVTNAKCDYAFDLGLNYHVMPDSSQRYSKPILRFDPDMIETSTPTCSFSTPSKYPEQPPQLNMADVPVHSKPGPSLTKDPLAAPFRKQFRLSRFAKYFNID